MICCSAAAPRSLCPLPAIEHYEFGSKESNATHERMLLDNSFDDQGQITTYNSIFEGTLSKACLNTYGMMLGTCLTKQTNNRIANARRLQRNHISFRCTWACSRHQRCKKQETRCDKRCAAHGMVNRMVCVSPNVRRKRMGSVEYGSAHRHTTSVDSLAVNKLCTLSVHHIWKRDLNFAKGAR